MNRKTVGDKLLPYVSEFVQRRGKSPAVNALHGEIGAGAFKPYSSARTKVRRSVAGLKAGRLVIGLKAGCDLAITKECVDLSPEATAYFGRRSPSLEGCPYAVGKFGVCASDWYQRREDIQLWN